MDTRSSSTRRQTSRAVMRNDGGEGGSGGVKSVEWSEAAL